MCVCVCTLIYELFLKAWLLLVLFVLTDGERDGLWMAYGGLPFSGTGCPVPDVANIYFIWNV